jgi:cell division ATPase FtsA
MTQNSQTLSPHLQEMKIEMELRGLSPQTLQHYLVILSCWKNILTSLRSKSRQTKSNVIFITVSQSASATVTSQKRKV